MLLLPFPQGYGEEGLYSEQESIASAPMFGPGIVGKKLAVFQTKENQVWSKCFFK